MNELLQEISLALVKAFIWALLITCLALAIVGGFFAVWSIGRLLGVLIVRTVDFLGGLS